MLPADILPAWLPDTGGDADLLVSIVVLSWNRKRELRETLERVRGLPDRPRELIVVDNGSSDGSAEMVRQLFPEVRLLALPQNVGINGLNAGLEIAQGEVIVLLDDDSHPVPGALTHLVVAFGRDATLGIAACRIEGPPGWWEAKWPWESPVPGAEVPTFIGCGVGLRHAALLRAGYFDAAFFLYQNELDLAARVVDVGYRVRYFPEIRFIHSVSPSNRSSRREEYYGLRNLLWVLWKYFPYREAALLTFRVAVERIAYCLLHCDLPRAGVATSALWAAATGRRTPLRRRVLSAYARQRLLVYIDHWYPPVSRWFYQRLRRRAVA